jgi:hypothetical protein
MKFVVDATEKTGDTSTTNVKAMKLSISTQEWNHSISNTFLNPTVKIRGKCWHAESNGVQQQKSFIGEWPEATEEYNEIMAYNTGRDANS